MKKMLLCKDCHQRAVLSILLPAVLFFLLTGCGLLGKKDTAGPDLSPEQAVAAENNVASDVTKEAHPLLNPEQNFDVSTLSESITEYPFKHFPRYRIAPGDVLDVLFQIRTWQEKSEFLLSVDNTVEIKFPNAPEMNESQIIRPNGMISLPYVGEMRVVGMTINELTEKLKKIYSTILRDPDLYVVVPDFRSSIKELKADLHTAPRGLSRLVTVSPDGYVTFPMVGEHYVYNKTISEMNEILNKEYENIMEGLHVDLFLEHSSGSMISVFGQVKSSGVYSIRKPVTVAEAIAIAGGHLDGAELASVVVVRRHETKMIATRIDLASNLQLSPGSKFIFLQPDDIVYVPKTRISKAAEVATYLADLLLFRGWNIGFGWELHDAAAAD